MICEFKQCSHRRMCLVLGPSGSGKTLLLKRLQYCASGGSYSDLEPAPITIPTVGTNLVNVSVGKRSEVTLRELGGSMAPIWSHYYRDCTSVLFTIDASNRQQVAAASILLYGVLTAAELQKVSVLIAINKCDMLGSMNRAELQAMIRLDDALRHAGQPATRVIECSARDGGQGLAEIGQWIQQQVRQSTLAP